VGIEREDRNFFLVGDHEPHSARHITTRPAMHAAISVIRRTVELTSEAQHFSALDPEFFKARTGADFFVFPPHYLFIKVAAHHHLQSNMPEVRNHRQQGDCVPPPYVGAHVAVHHLGLALHNPRDTQVYLATAMPDTRQTAPVVLGVPVEDLYELHFASTARQNPQQFGLIDPRLLLQPPKNLAA
jgi:hypothetical protein